MAEQYCVSNEEIDKIIAVTSPDVDWYEFHDHISAIELNAGFKELKAFRAELSELRHTLEQTKRLCEMITGSPNTTKIKGAIESMALILGHHKYVLNPHILSRFQNDTESK